jgi:hypothetical protein
MSFPSLTEAADRLRTLLQTTTGRDLIDIISLDAPENDETELSFHKAVMWGYVFWYEACQPAGRHILNIIRNTSQDGYKNANRAFLDVQNLRTFKAHNLLINSKSDQYKLTQSKAWLAQNGANNGDWHSCTRSICNSLSAAINLICDTWETMISCPEDAEVAVQDLLNVIDREWPGHLFDNMIEEASASIGLSDIDAVTYRNGRLNDWRAITELFAERVSAEAAVKRAILQELTLKFGAQ